MVSEVSWQTGGGGTYGNAPSAEGPMDQQSVESLLRRLVERVEESEHRYSEALDEVHARLDQLAQTTDAARATGAPEDAETFDRLHDQVSSLAQRLEQESSSPLDDFERLGRALTGDADYGAPSGAPDLLSALAASSMPQSEAPFAASGPFSFSRPETDHSLPPLTPSLPSKERDLDNRLVEMAHRLEHSIGTAMPPQALEALNARLDEIGDQIAKALDEAPKGPSLDHFEHQISDMAQQLGRAEAQLAKIGEIEAQLHRLIERVDANPAQLEEVANKAASETARLVADEAKLGAGTTERLDAMHRDLMAMNERTRASDDRLATTIAAVHESLKQLVQQVERSAPQPAAPKPRVPFAERMRDLAPLPGTPGQQPVADKGERPKAGDPGAGPGAKDASARNRLAAALSDIEETDITPPFGRAKRGQPDEKAFDLDRPNPRRALAKTQDDADYDTPDDLVAAARRAAKAAALRAEERSNGPGARRVSAGTDALAGAELPARRKRSFLIICAAVLLAISAMLFYGRLRSKPEPEITPPAVEQSIPVPSAPSEGTATPGEEESAPAAVEPEVETPPTPSSSELEPETEAGAEDAVGEAGQTGNFTDVAKSSYRQAAASEALAQPQPASLKPTEAAALPPGIVFSIEDPALGAQAAAAPAGPSGPPSLPASLPLPPPISVRFPCARPRRKAMHARNTRSRSATPRAKTPLRISPKRHAGSNAPQAQAWRRPSTVSLSCTSADRV